MCISPITIRNPNHGLCSPSSLLYRAKDFTSAFIEVPCGHCAECIYLRQSSLVQRVIVQSMDSYVYFSTLTYNNESMPYVLDSFGRRYNCCSFDDLRNMMKRIRKSNILGRDFKYLAVSELGSKRGRPHFHILWFIKKLPHDDKLVPYMIEPKLYDLVFSEWKRNYGTSAHPYYKPLFTFKQKFINGKLNSNFDTHLIRSRNNLDSFSDVAFYVSKYMLKPSKKSEVLRKSLYLGLCEEEYQELWKDLRCRYVKSLDFGIPDSEFFDLPGYIQECVTRSLRESSSFPKFFSPLDGSFSVLSRFYRNKFVSGDDMLKFADFKDRDGLDGHVVSKVVKNVDYRASVLDKFGKTNYMHTYFDSHADLLLEFDE